jgi:hypothetical protein
VAEKGVCKSELVGPQGREKKKKDEAKITRRKEIAKRKPLSFLD